MLGMDKETLRRLSVGGLWFITTWVYIFARGGEVPGFDGRGNPRMDMLILILLTLIFHRTINWIFKKGKSDSSTE